jgi:Uma2 family endonuclease
MSFVSPGREATLEDLWEFDGPAELIEGRIVPVTPSVFRPGRSASRISRSLDAYEAAHGGGYAISDGVGFVLRTPRTQMLMPDAAWWTGTPRDDEPLDGAPAFAAEVRGRNDYGPTAERAMALKRGLYFAAGTQVVWDVDVLREGLVRVYRADAPEHPTVYRRGEVAEAEPAVPGWRMAVDELFD